MRRVIWTVVGVFFGILVAPAVAPVVMRMGRPVMKTTAKAGLLAFRSGHESIMRLRESLDDILAELKDELTCFLSSNVHGENRRCCVHFGRSEEYYDERTHWFVMRTRQYLLLTRPAALA